MPRLSQHGLCLSMKPQLNVIHLKTDALPWVLLNKSDLNLVLSARELFHFTSVLCFITSDHTNLSHVRPWAAKKVPGLLLSRLPWAAQRWLERWHLWWKDTAALTGLNGLFVWPPPPPAQRHGACHFCPYLETNTNGLKTFPGTVLWSSGWFVIDLEIKIVTATHVRPDGFHH